MVVYALLIHFTGQHYEGWLYLILFLFLFCMIDMVVGTLIDGFLHAVTDSYESIFVNKLIANIFGLIGTYVVMIALDFFFTVIDLSTPIVILIVVIHFVSSLLVDQLDKDGEIDDKMSGEIYQIDPEVEGEITALLKTGIAWVDCVKMIQEKHPYIPKGKIIAVTRKIHMENK